jgi:hypothetical protein
VGFLSSVEYKLCGVASTYQTNATKLESVKLGYLIEVTGKRKKEKIRGEEGKIARTKPLIRYLDRHAV